jgi:DNA-binding transcriptional LysR family regulator
LKGHVRVFANTSALTEFMPETLSAFLAGNPGIDVDIEEKPSHDIVRLVAEGFVDIGIVADIVDFAGLDVVPFATDRLVLIMPQHHRLARRRRIRFRDVIDEDFVGMVATNALQQHLAQHALQAGKPLRLRARLGSFEAVSRMVENGIGLAVIPETAALRCQKLMAIRIARLADMWSLRPLPSACATYTHCRHRAGNWPNTSFPEAPLRRRVRQLNLQIETACDQERCLTACPSWVLVA